jgi:hypothetical protein
MVSSSIFLLIDCPKGHALISSSNGLTFSQQAQQCIPCGKEQYIINTSSSLFHCQPCPAGAQCNGSDLTSRVQGGIWTVSSIGQYILESCPPGYELQNTVGGVFSHAIQQCQTCPARYFCPGARATRLPCPGAGFSPSGSSTVDSCADMVLVESVVVIPMSVANFDPLKQRDLVFAFALACAVPVDYVEITSIVPFSTRSEVSIQVYNWQNYLV